MFYKLKTLLDGKKTIIGYALGVIYSVVIFAIPELNNQLVWTAIVSWTGVSYRLAISKSK